jgi:gas vesicle protein
MSKNSAKLFAVGSLVAVATGYVAGILTAPKSGKETRKDIKDKTAQSVQQAQKQLKKLNSELSDKLDQAKSQLNSATGRAKDELDRAVRVGGTVNDHVRNTLSSVHEGETGDKELDKAIKDAQKAVDELKAALRNR